MSGPQRAAIAMEMITEKFEPGMNVVSEGDAASSFYIIKSVTLFLFLILIVLGKSKHHQRGKHCGFPRGRKLLRGKRSFQKGHP